MLLLIAANPDPAVSLVNPSNGNTYNIPCFQFYNAQYKKTNGEWGCSGEACLSHCPCPANEHSTTTTTTTVAPSTKTVITTTTPTRTNVTTKTPHASKNIQTIAVWDNTVDATSGVLSATCDCNKTSPNEYYNYSSPFARNYSSSPAFGETPECSDGANDGNWRILLAIGALPGIIMLPFKVSETSATVSKSQNRESTFWKDISRREFWPKLLGTAGGWFLFDIVFYGNNLFKAVILSAVWPGSADLATGAKHSAIIFAIALPGYWVATIFMDKLGRKNIQLLGFTMMFVLYLALSFQLEKDGDKWGPKKDAEGNQLISSGTLLFIYALTFFFANFGPNSTTFILPSETFPEEVRTSLNGFSAAMGKTGAAIGSAMFAPLAKSIGTPGLLQVCAVVSLLGVAVTYFFVIDFRGKNMAGNESSMGYSAINADDDDNLTSPVGSRRR